MDTPAELMIDLAEMKEINTYYEWMALHIATPPRISKAALDKIRATDMDAAISELEAELTTEYSVPAAAAPVKDPAAQDAGSSRRPRK